jgi:hypothetical protein
LVRACLCRLKSDEEVLFDKNPCSFGVLEALKCVEEDLLNWLT